jgi:hypothetical protein
MFTTIHHTVLRYYKSISRYSSSSFYPDASRPVQHLLGALATEREEDQKNSEGLDQEVLGLVEGNYLGREEGYHLEGRCWGRMEVDLLRNHLEVVQYH